MKELQTILAEWGAIERAGGSAALATVVDVRGSAYRRPGARMLIAADGRTTGGVSGGCLESDVIERARLTLFTGRPALAEYDTTGDDDLIFGTGMGCHGVVRVLIERLAPGPETAWIEPLRAILRRRQRGALATVCAAAGPNAPPPGARFLLADDGALAGSYADPALTADALADARIAVETGESRVKHYAAPGPRGLKADVFIEAILPPLPLVIFGAGHDAAPLVRWGKELGWHVTVVDGRPAWVTAARFPLADALVVARPESISGHVAVGPDAAAVVMTHNYAHDLNLLRALLRSPARYVGLLGSRDRSRRLLDDLSAEGLWSVSQGTPRRLFAPVGLDVGARTPEEIALAIVAEIQAAFRGRSGGFLGGHSGEIRGEGTIRSEHPTSNIERRTSK